MESSGMKSTLTDINRIRLHLGAIAATLAAVFLSACATSGAQNQVIIDRAKARWEAIVAQDFDTAYDYYSPGFRSSLSRFDYEFQMRKRRIVYNAAQFVSHYCEESRCTLTFQVGYGVTRPLPGVGTWENKKLMVETWVLTDGEWWYVPGDN